MLDEDSPYLVRADAGVMAKRLADQLLHLAERLDAGEPAADDDEGEQPSLAPGIRCRVGLL